MLSCIVRRQQNEIIDQISDQLNDEAIEMYVNHRCIQQLSKQKLPLTSLVAHCGEQS